MSKATSPVDICNISADYLAEDPITSIDTITTVTEAIFARHYDNVRRALLRAYGWNFAKKYGTLSRNGTPDPASYTDSYALPNDFLKLRNIGSSERYFLGDYDYDIVGTNIYMNTGGAASLNIIYTFDEKLVTKYDALFVLLLAATLADSVSYRFDLSNKSIARIERKVVEYELKAAAKDGQEHPPRKKERSRSVSSRRRHGAGLYVSGPYSFEEW